MTEQKDKTIQNNTCGWFLDQTTFLQIYRMVLNKEYLEDTRVW